MDIGYIRDIDFFYNRRIFFDTVHQRTGKCILGTDGRGRASVYYLVLYHYRDCAFRRIEYFGREGTIGHYFRHFRFYPWEIQS